jgi:hypothetical protein
MVEAQVSAFATHAQLAHPSAEEPTGLEHPREVLELTG